MKRFYILPKVDNGMGGFDPKYIVDAGLQAGAIDYGLEDTFLVGCEITPEQHTLLASQLDVISIPAEIDQQIGLSALSVVQSRLEGLHVPSDWVTTSHTYRDVIQLTGKLFSFMQEFHFRQLRKFFEGEMSLDTRVNQLTTAQRSAMIDVALDLGLSIDGITNSTTLRQALKILADQMPSFVLFGETF